MGFKIVSLNSGKRAVAFLGSAAIFAKGELAQHRYLAPFFSEVLRLRGVAPEARSLLMNAEALKLREGETMAKALKSLKLHVRHFKRVLGMRVSRGEMDKEDLSLYILPHEKRIPMQKKMDFVCWGKDFVQGDELYVKQGGEPMANPSAAELQDALDAYLTALKEYNMRDEIYREARSVMNGYFHEIQDLYKIIAHTVKVLLVGEKPSYVRNVLRRIGYTYMNTETPDVPDAMEGVEESVPQAPAETKAVEAGRSGQEQLEADSRQDSPAAITYDGERMLYDGLDEDDYREYLGKEPLSGDSS